MPSKWRTLRSQTVYNGRLIQVKVDRVIEPGNARAVREVVHHSGSVVVLPHFSDGRVLLVRQFRYPAQRSLWELVAGSMEPGESAVEAAARELAEETGYAATRLRELLAFYPSPGFLTERMVLVEARGLTRSKPHPEADERIAARRFTRSRLRRMLDTHKFQDAKTLVGLLWLLLSRCEKICS